jgi:hypothetical protein
MQSINLLKTKIHRKYAMDRESDRYRVCPNDGVEFMANHRSEKHCCPECADEFDYIKKKNAKEELVKSKNELEKVKQNKTIPVVINPTNITILDELTIQESGSLFYLEYLQFLGVDFEKYNGRGELYNIDPDLNCHFLQMGPYRLYRVEFSQVLIKKTY